MQYSQGNDACNFASSFFTRPVENSYDDSVDPIDNQLFTEFFVPRTLTKQDSSENFERNVSQVSKF